MLRIENEYKTPIESNYYQNKKIFVKNLKFQIIAKTSQNISNKNLKGVQVQTTYTKMQQIKYNYQKKKFGRSHFS